MNRGTQLGATVVAASLAIGGAFGAAALAGGLDDDGPARPAPLRPAPLQPAPPDPPSLDVGPAGDGDRMAVTFADSTARDGTELFVWRSDALATPLWLRREGGEWIVASDPWGAEPAVSAGDGSVTVIVGAAAGIAASASGGVRAPAVGHIDANGRPILLEGAATAALEESLATAQRGFGELDPFQRELVSSLLARQAVEGAYSYRVRGANGSEAVADVSVRFPLLSQLSDSGGGLYVTPEEVITCADVSARGTCRPSSSVRTPVGTAATVATDPAAVTVEELAGGEWQGQATRCMRVGNSGVEGPSPGRWCWLPDGVVAHAELDNGTVTTLERRELLDPVRLEPPTS